MNNTKLLIFDVTGVLTTDGHLISSLLKSILPEKDRDMLKRYFRMYELGQITHDEFWKNIGVENSEEIEQKLIDKVVLRDGTIQVLENLKNRYQLAILSNMSKEWAEKLNEKFQLDRYFREMIYSADYGIIKPDKEIYEILLKKYPNVELKDITFVDDTLGNLESAKKLGIHTIWFKAEEDNSPYVPDIIIKDIKELIEL